MREATGTISNKDINNEQAVNEIIRLVSTREISFEIVNENIKNSTVINNVTILLSKSAEFKNLDDTRATLEETLSFIPEQMAAKRLEISARLDHQKNVIREFVRDILTLAAQFDRIEIDTERLRRAREFFEKGEFSRARAILETEVDAMRDEQARLLIKREEYESETLPKLKNNSEEFLVLALSTQADHAKANRYEAAREYFERSIESNANESNVFYYAYFLAKHKQFAAAEKYYRRYLDEFPDRISPDEKAMILNNLANLHTNLNRYDEAAAEFEEALRIYRNLNEAEPDDYLPDVAMSLNNLAVLHKSRHEFEKALPAYDEALRIYSDLNEAASGAYLPDLARTLNNLANLYKDQYKYDDALREYTEALRIYRALEEANPQAHLPSVAVSLNNLAVLHKNQNRYEEAASEYSEALRIYRGLAAADPHIYLPSVAGTLVNLANLHQAEDKREAALKEYDEALKFYRDLAAVNPDAYQPYVAATLNNLAVLHKTGKEYDAAAPEFEESVRLYRALAESDPEAYLSYAAGALNNLATLYHEECKYAEALRKYEETLKIRRDLYRQAPDAAAPDLAMTLINLAMFYQAPTPEREKSIEYAKEAIILLVPLRQSVPYTQNYMQAALGVLVDWGLTDEQIRRLIAADEN